jgi:hypothetical protein
MYIYIYIQVNTAGEDPQERVKKFLLLSDGDLEDMMKMQV